VRPYEVMFIFDADLEEETIRSAVARYTQLIESRGAEPGPIDYWGKRRFAYELAHRWEGYYVVLQARAEPAAMEELHRVLSLADEVLRHKVLRIPEQVYGKLAGSAPPPPTAATERQASAAPEREEGSVEPEASGSDDTEREDAEAAAADA